LRRPYVSSESLISFTLATAEGYGNTDLADTVCCGPPARYNFSRPVILHVVITAALERERERDHQGEDDVLRQIDLEGKEEAEILHRIANHLEGEVLVRVTSRLMKEMRTPTSSSGR
jgi:hypothetical protein